MRVGLLLANSKFIDRLAGDIRRAVDLGLRHGGLANADLVVETTSYNESISGVRAGVQDLAIKHDVDVVVLPLNPSLAPEVADLAKGQSMPVILLSMGEDVCIGDSAPPWVFSIDFGLWSSAWLIGHDAAKTRGTNVSIISAPHGGGYGLTFAAALGAEAAGGEIRRLLPIVSGLTSEDTDRVLAVLRSDDSDSLIVLGAASEQDELIARCQSILPDVPVVGLAPPRFAHGADADGSSSAHSITSWNPVSGPAVAFSEAFGAATGRLPHPHAVMAYEAGLALASCANARGPALRDALNHTQIDGPRGVLTFDAETLTASAPQFHVTFMQGEAPAPASAHRVDPPEALNKHRETARLKTQKQGWLNPFLMA